jgi:thiol-disulfide isomerase/thioredoxin
LLVVILGLNVWWFTTGQGQVEETGGLSGPAPAFELPLLSLSGVAKAQETLALEDLSGKVVLLDFWATYCGPCKRQMPVLQRLHRSMDPEKFSLVSVNIDKAGNKEALISKYLKERGYTFPVVLDNGETRRAYKVRSIPTMILVSPEGKVGFVHSGLLSEKRLREKIATLMGDDA